MTSDPRLERYKALLRKTPNGSAMPEDELRSGLSNVLLTADKVFITDEKDVLRLAELMIFEFEKLDTYLRKEYFLRVLADDEVEPANRIAMLECLISR